MPVEKLDGARLRHDRVPFEIVPRDVIQSIPNPDALAIWVYLLTKPTNWVVRKTEIMEHFSIGRDRYAAAMRYLRDEKLVVHTHIKDETGSFMGSCMWVYGFKPEDTGFGDVRNLEAPENYSLKEQESLLKNKRTIKRFSPPSVDEVRNYIKEHNYTIDPEAFVDFYEARGWMLNKTPMKSWQAAVRTWTRNDRSLPAKPALNVTNLKNYK